MHRRKHVLPIALGTLLLGLTLSSVAPAQQPPPAPREGQPAGRSLALVVPINGTQRLQMSTKKRIKNVANERETVARVQSTPDPATVLITGLEPGITHVKLTDEDGAEESVDVIVQFDVEYLRSLLQRTVPTANINPIPGANSTIILTGNVARAEDVDVVMRTTVGVVGSQDRVINALRVGGVMQVQLDVVVAQVSRDEFRRMSFDFIEVGQHHTLASTVGGAFILPSSGISPLSGFPQIQNTIGTPNGVPANLFLGVFDASQSFFGLLQALRDESVVKLMAEPRLVTQSGRPASFLSGGEQAVPVPAGLGQVGVQFEEFGTRLNFLPIVLGNGKIHLEVEPEVSNLNPAFGTSINGTVVPGRTTQRIHTTVELEDGQTFVLGGLIQHTVEGSVRKVPIVGDLPFLGSAFSTKSFNETEAELIVAVTPHLVDAMSCDQAPKVFPGQETRSPDDFELFLEGILEAPRGARAVFPEHHYVPAYKNGPTASIYPCAGDGRSGAACKSGAPTGAACAPSGSPLPAATDAKSVNGEDVTRPVGSNGVATPPKISPPPAAPGSEERPLALPPIPGGSGSTEGQQ
jgi:pilus assembly protein CpaC